MRQLFESNLHRGFLDFFGEEERLFVSSGFSRAARGVTLEIGGEEAADLTEALLRHLDPITRLSVIESVLGYRHDKVETDSKVDAVA